MTNESVSSTKIVASKRKNLWIISSFFGIFCAFLIGVLTYVADSNSPQESLNPAPANSYYNLLVQGFQSGQLNMKMQAPPELATLADPYNPNHSWDTGY